jgi:glutamine---fructose-6-phosphate transaminase (isomerizing)
MEYRGYDSVGIATLAGDLIQVRKGVGRVDHVNDRLKLEGLAGNVGIGHTRWATHGGVTEANAHPHSSSTGRIAIVHNGIIDNYLELKEMLKEKGFYFKSQTDSEVIANLLQMNYDETEDVKKAMLRTVSQLKGSYAFIAMFHDGTLATARYNEPLIIGQGDGDYYISSDVLGFVEHAIDAIFLRDEEMAILDSKGLHLCNFYGVSVQPSITKLAREIVNAEKGDFAHFTMKEIFEQPTTFQRIENSSPEFELLSEYLKYAGHVYITGSGTSYNAAIVGCYLLRKYAKINAEPLVASEVPFLPLRFDRQSVVLALSQSGESADVLNAVHIAKKAGAKIISIVNVTTSSLVRESSVSIGLNCGPEIGVAATKSFTSQLGFLYRLAEKLSGLAFKDFSKVSESMGEILLAASKVEEIARELRNVNDIYVLGRGIHFPIAIEGALKIKEISYIHAEGVSGGELKHGPLAMMHDGVYVIMINPNDSTYIDTLAGGNEIRARGAKIIGISDVPNRIYDRWIKIPTVSDALYPIVEAVPFQLLAYYAAVERNADPDYPRNLAKCVTVK